ncbi:hypothetical protein IHE45_07G133900 [Dioscorea alata]|uniref:Uncharacterized protein n=1 Tax=Dioscorea alata TaxID=55571 RepID=A0ACB7VV16_DIOAL|nr:hypothetical protein IHE45_07G133900 [Dioscorea alata]
MNFVIYLFFSKKKKKKKSMGSARLSFFLISHDLPIPTGGPAAWREAAELLIWVVTVPDRSTDIYLSPHAQALDHFALLIFFNNQQPIPSVHPDHTLEEVVEG